MTISKIGTDPFNNTITIEQQQRRQGLYIIGSTGRGKTVLLENLIMQEITQGIGLCVLDPHRDLTRRIIELMPQNRLQDVILLDIANNDYAFGLNLYSSPTQSVKDVQYTIERIMHIWERLFNISRLTPQMVQYMRKCAETLIPNPGYTMAEIPMLFDDIPFRNKLLTNVTDPNVLRFWQRHDAKPKIDKSRETDAILNKLDEFLTGMVIPIVGQSKSTLDFRTLMDTRSGKIILVQLDPNLDSITSLIGSMIVALVRNAAFSRENMLQNKRKHFSVYADEFDRFATLDFKSIMDECRKYGVAATIAHQTRDVLHRDIPGLVRSTLQGNLVVFQITAPDAEELAGNFDTTPNMEESGRRKKQVPVIDVVAHLLKTSHKDPVVNQFTLQIIQDCPEPYKSETLNNLLYKAMIGEDISQYCVTRDMDLPLLVPLGLGYLSYILMIAASEYGYRGLPYNEPSVYIPARKAMQQFWSAPIGSRKSQLAIQIMDACLRVVLRWEKLNMLQNELFEILRLFEGDMLSQWEKKHPEETWYQIDPYRVRFHKVLVEKKLSDLLPWRYPPPLGTYTEKETQLVPGQEKKFYREHDLAQVIEKELYSLRKTFLDNFALFRSACHALAQTPILGDSGEEEIILRPGSHADKQKEIANMLSSLPILHAYTRIGGEVQGCWNCGGQTKSTALFCGSCGKKLKPEYHLTITPSSQGLPRSVVEERIAAIIQNNVRDGYLRPRADVLAEIQARQQPPAPQPMQNSPNLRKPIQQPPAEASRAVPRPPAKSPQPVPRSRPQSAKKAPIPPAPAPAAPAISRAMPLPQSRRRKPK